MTRIALTAYASLFGFALASCGGDGAATASTKRTFAFEVAADATVAPDTIVGTTFFEGTPPPRRPIVIDSSAGCPDHGGQTLTETALIVDGRIQNVFVEVARGLDASKVPPPPAEPVALEQRGCTYQPHVLGVRVGQKLAVHNADPTMHNVNAKAQRGGNPSFNNNQPPGAPAMEVVFTAPETLVPFRCDVHPWMGAWVHAVEHPYFALSAADGSFKISGLPPGEYELEAVHEWLGRERFKVTLDGHAGARVELRWRTETAR